MFGERYVIQFFILMTKSESDPRDNGELTLSHPDKSRRRQIRGIEAGDLSCHDE